MTFDESPYEELTKQQWMLLFGASGIIPGMHSARMPTSSHLMRLNGGRERLVELGLAESKNISTFGPITRTPRGIRWVLDVCDCHDEMIVDEFPEFPFLRSGFDILQHYTAILGTKTRKSQNTGYFISAVGDDDPLTGLSQPGVVHIPYKHRSMHKVIAIISMRLMWQVENNILTDDILTSMVFNSFIPLDNGRGHLKSVHTRMMQVLDAIHEVNQGPVGSCNPTLPSPYRRMNGVPNARTAQAESL